MSSVRRGLLILSTVVLLGLILPPGALAHVGKAAPVVDVAPPLATTVLRAAPAAAPPIFLALGFVAGVLAALALRRQPRRVLVLALGVLLAVFAVEAGIHSVHHLGERVAAACPIASAAGHLSLCLDTAPPAISLSLRPAGTIVDRHLASPAAPGLGPDLARAPPAPIA